MSYEKCEIRQIRIKTLTQHDHLTFQSISIRDFFPWHFSYNYHVNWHPRTRYTCQLMTSLFLSLDSYKLYIFTSNCVVWVMIRCLKRKEIFEWMERIGKTWLQQRRTKRNRGKVTEGRNRKKVLKLVALYVSEVWKRRCRKEVPTARKSAQFNHPYGYGITDMPAMPPADLNSIDETQGNNYSAQSSRYTAPILLEDLLKEVRRIYNT